MVPPSSTTWATAPGTQETGPPSVEAPSSPMVFPSRPADQAALTILANQVQQLSTSQSSSQKKLQSMYASQQAVQQQMQSLLAHLQPQRPPQPQHTTPPALPQTSSAPPSHTQPPIPQGPVPTPTVIQDTTQMPQGIHNPSGAMLAPPLVMNILGRSLTLYFPDVKLALLLAITKHEMYPGQIFKVDPQL